MKLSTLLTLLSLLLALIFSGCGTPKPNPEATIDSSLPKVQLTHNGTKQDMTSIALEWEALEDTRVQGIYVYRVALDDNKSSLAEDAYYDTIENRSSTHYLDVDLIPNSRYKYYFTTYSKVAQGKKNQSVIARTKPILDSVSWIHAIKDMPRSTKIIWRPHTDKIVNGYEIRRRTLEDKEWKTIGVVDGRLRAEYIDEGLSDKHTYIYTLYALTYNKITSKPSKEVQITTKALPQEVQNIKATNNQPRQITITWQKTNDGDFLNYNLYRSKKVDGGYKLIANIHTNSFIDKIDEDGVKYFYRVSIVDKDGLESTYDVNSAQGVTVVKPKAPALVEAKILDNTIVFKWAKTDDRTISYTVSKRYKKGMFNEEEAEFDGITRLSYIDTKIEPDTSYYFKVYAVDKDGIRSPASQEVELVTQPVVTAPKEVKEN